MVKPQKCERVTDIHRACVWAPDKAVTVECDFDLLIGGGSCELVDRRWRGVITPKELAVVSQTASLLL
jgi:hypothetical protein